ncbi:flavodoxin family protein [Chloroflexota bacterium]
MVAKVLIIYYSQGGNTEAMAKAVYEGVKSAETTVSLKKAGETTADDILNCDTVILGTPCYFDYMAGMMKDFLDRVWYTIRDKMEGKNYALFTSSGTGEKHALERLDFLCNFLKLNKVADDIVAMRAPSTETLEKCKETGKKVAQS